jgi:ketosteroid isomerase-like protein
MKVCVKGLTRSASAGCVILVATCLAVAAQQGSVAVDQSARVLSLENAWNQAEVTHDAQALSTLLAETFDFTDDDGRFMNKSQWLAHIRNGVDHYDQLSSSGMSVQLCGNVAVATGMYQYKTTEKGKGVMRSGRFTDVWIQQNAKWKCVASQATLITK